MRLQANQLALFPEVQPALQVGIKRSFSDLLWNSSTGTIPQVEDLVELDDEVFEALCIARIVEPTSKLDSLRVLADLGVEPIDQNKLYRCLAKLRIRITGK